MDTNETTTSATAVLDLAPNGGDGELDTIAQAVDRGLQWCRDGLLPSDAIDADKLSLLSDGLLREMARRGWVAAITGAMHSARTAPTAPGGAALNRSAVMHASMGRNPRLRWQYLEAIRLQAGDSMKPLIDFTLPDLLAAYGEAGSQVKAWGARRDWFAAARKELRGAKVERVGELDRETVARLDRLAGEAWTR